MPSVPPVLPGSPKFRDQGKGLWYILSGNQTGQLAALPLQFSAGSHCPVVARHSVVAGSNRSAGQVSALPVQFSAISHTSAAVLHTVVAGSSTSAGQLAQFPCKSPLYHTAPLTARHTVTRWLKYTSAGQLAELPVQFSARSHTPAAALHSVVTGSNPSAGQVAELPVQVSATSHTSAAVLHTVVAGSAHLPDNSLALPVQFSAMSHAPPDALHSVVAGANTSAGQLVAHFPYRSLPCHILCNCTDTRSPAVQYPSAGQLDHFPYRSLLYHTAPADALHSVPRRLKHICRTTGSTSRTGLCYVTQHLPMPCTRWCRLKYISRTTGSTSRTGLCQVTHILPMPGTRSRRRLKITSAGQASLTLPVQDLCYITHPCNALHSVVAGSNIISRTTGRTSRTGLCYVTYILLMLCTPWSPAQIHMPPHHHKIP